MSSSGTFLALLQKGPDTPLLRYSLGNALYREKKYQEAIEHLTSATKQDQSYSAAWKLLGRCFFDIGNYAQAVTVYERGLEIAAGRGDKQAEKEMRVFLRRSLKRLEDG